MGIVEYVMAIFGRQRTTCPRCGGPLVAVGVARRGRPAARTCPRCDLRARWAASPGRRRI